MNFRPWIEQKWFEFKETVTLYHGTSSALVPKLKTEGIKPPDESLEAYALKIIKSYGKEPSPPLIDWILKNSLSMRSDNPAHKTSNVIYLSPKFQQAEGYATSYYQFGGEIASEIWRAINVIESKKKGLPHMEKIVPPIYPDAHPVVIEVEIPYAWAKSYYDLHQRHLDGLKLWKSLKQPGKDKTVEDFMQELGDFEMRVEETIPPKMIKKVHSLEKPKKEAFGDGLTNCDLC